MAKKKQFSDLNKSSDPPVVFLLKLGNMVHLFLYSKNWKQLLSNSAGSSLMEVFKDVSVQDTYPHGRLSDCIIETFFISGIWPDMASRISGYEKV